MKFVSMTACVALLLAAGCASSYSWRSSVPAEKRTVHVPSFENETDLMETGAISARQVAREFQREGTFRLASAEDAAIEIQGRVKSFRAAQTGYNRRQSSRYYAYRVSMTAEISVIDKRENKVLIENRPYEAMTTLSLSQDVTTAQRDANGRIAEDLARQIVDDVLKIQW